MNWLAVYNFIVSQTSLSVVALLPLGKSSSRYNSLMNELGNDLKLHLWELRKRHRILTKQYWNNETVFGWKTQLFSLVWDSFERGFKILFRNPCHLFWA